MRHRQGFTLLEVLVAVAITATLSLALYGSLAVAFQAERAGRRAVEPMQAVDAAFDLIRHDLEAILIPNRGLLSGEFVGEDFGAAAARMSFRTAAGISEIESPQVDEQPVSLTRLLAQQPDRIGSDIVGVTWTLAPSPPGGATSPQHSRLVRLVQRNLLSPVETAPVQQVICHNVVSLQIRFYDGTHWRAAWDSVYEDPVLPQAIEVAMEVVPDALEPSGPAQATRRWTRVFSLPMARHTGEATVR